MSTKEKVVFKNYTPNQMMMLPPSLEELIDKNHPVRIVNQIIERIDIDPLLKKFKGGGTSKNIHFMWLAGMNKPDHNTINRFRSERLKDVLKTVFGKVVELLVEAGHLDFTGSLPQQRNRLSEKKTCRYRTRVCQPQIRFMLKGIDKVEIETGLLALAHNLPKMAA